MVSGSQAWGVGSVQRAGTGNLRLGEVKARCNLIPRVSCLTAPGASEESERLQTTQTCCLGQSAEEQLLYQDHSSQIWLREIVGLGRLGIASPPMGALAIFLGATLDSKDDGVKN